MIKLNVTDESSALEVVVLGIAEDRGMPRSINPMMRKHINNKTFPSTESICREIKSLETVLINNKVQIFRPKNVTETEQIFTRDIGFVIDDYFFIANMRHSTRSNELKGIQYLFKHFDQNKLVRLPEEAIIEGGDVVLWRDYVFIGLGDRTTKEAVNFLREFFPNKNILSFELNVDQDNAITNVLHLDCIFQPIGHDEAIICLDGFKKKPIEILEIFPKKRLLELTMEQKTIMVPNIISISPEKIVIEKGFRKLKADLIKRNYKVFEVDYSETSKLNGLLRCSILPLRRSKKNTFMV